MEYFTKFESILKKYNPNILDKLLAPESLLKIENVLLELYNDDRIKFELEKIYNWKGGTNIDFNSPKEFSYIVPNYIFNSLDTIKEIVQEDEFYNFKGIKLFPLFSTGDGEYLSLFFEDILKKGVFNSKLYLCSTNDFEIDNVTSIFDSLESFLKVGEVCYENKIYYLENNEYELDFDTYWDLCSDLNINSDYWHR